MFAVFDDSTDHKLFGNAYSLAQTHCNGESEQAKTHRCTVALNRCTNDAFYRNRENTRQSDIAQTLG
jgi:hypothetical protein